MTQRSATDTAAVIADADWHLTEPWIRRGTRVVVWLVGGMLAWLMIVSISGAVMAPARVTVETSYQTVQHLYGGIVREILVRNGDTVEAGDVLVRLDATEVAANLSVARSRVRDLAIQAARLEAERDRRDAFEVPAGLDAADEETARIISAQRALFDARLTGRRGEQSVLGERRRQLEGEMRGVEAQLASAKKQAAINARELASIRPLYDKGYVNQQRIAPLEREAARLEGETGRLASEISKVQGSLMEVDLRIQQSEKAFTTEVVDELRKVQAALSEQRESERTFADRLARVDIRSPRAGRIHALKPQTIGGVVTAASPILQVIPDGERLIVAAELKTGDIDKVRVGQTAGVRFPALDSATTPRLEGQVVRVSPAELTDQNGRSYFTADVELSPEQLARLDAAHVLVPGMPAEVYFETGSHSMLSYLLKPLADAIAHTFLD
jgi:HlyD family secretion protein